MAGASQAVREMAQVKARIRAAAEVMARLMEQGNTKVKRIGPPFTAMPTSIALERDWYPTQSNIIEAVSGLLDVSIRSLEPVEAGEAEFKGPF